MIDYVIVGLVDFWRSITTFIDGCTCAKVLGSRGIYCKYMCYEIYDKLDFFISLGTHGDLLRSIFSRIRRNAPICLIL